MATVDGGIFALLKECEYGKWFLERSYGLELLCVLLAEGEVDGVERLYSVLCSPVPKRPAFYEYLKRLEAAGCVERYVSSVKRSSKGVRLSGNCRQAITQYLQVVEGCNMPPPAPGV